MATSRRLGKGPQAGLDDSRSLREWRLVEIRGHRLSLVRAPGVLVTANLGVIPAIERRTEPVMLAPTQDELRMRAVQTALLIAIVIGLLAFLAVG